MDELEYRRAWDQISKSLEAGLISEGRRGKSRIMLASAVLSLADGRKRIVYASDDAGDGEGLRPVAHLVSRARPRLRDGESIGLEVVTAELEGDGAWALSVKTRRAAGIKALDEFFDKEWIERRVSACRVAATTAMVSVAVLSLANGHRRVVFCDSELGDGEARAAVADLIRRANRLRLLEPAESLERLMVSFTRSATGWLASSRPDPLRGAR